MTPMSLGLSHSLSRYKLKFSPDKVDTMIVQVGALAGARPTLTSLTPFLMRHIVCVRVAESLFDASNVR